jgi:hypothetical protein
MKSVISVLPPCFNEAREDAAADEAKDGHEQARCINLAGHIIPHK